MYDDIPLFTVGDKVTKSCDDYMFTGTVVSVFRKASKAIRLVIEDDRGMLHISTETNLQHKA